MEKLALKSQPIMKYLIFELIKILLRWKWITKFSNSDADQLKDNATKLEYTNYGKNINGSPSFIHNSVLVSYTDLIV